MKSVIGRRRNFRSLLLKWELIKRLFCAMIMTDDCMGGAIILLVSHELRLLREKMLLTQEEFAKELGVASSTVNRWETGKARPNITTMRAIKKICENNNYPYEKIENAWIIH